MPTKALNLLDKLIADPEELVGMQVRENQVMFHTSNATLTTNLVEGQFPPYDDVIPKDADKKMTAATADFLGAVRRAALADHGREQGRAASIHQEGLGGDQPLARKRRSHGEFPVQV